MGVALPVSAIRCRDLEFRYPGDSFSMRVPELTVGEGEAVAVVGPSGCGKTTLLKLLAGILTPEGGEVEVAGSEVSTMGHADCQRFRIQNIGLVFQEFELLDYLTVGENLLLPFRVSNALTLTPDVSERLRELADGVDIGDLLGRYPEEISQGERQRAALCRALVARPKVVLADEPTGSLDPDNQDRTVRLLRDRVTEAGASLLMVTHNHELLDGFERVIELPEILRRR